MPKLNQYASLRDGGVVQMAIDEYLLTRAEAGQASFRFYTWNPPTLSLGYFQPHAERLRVPGAETLPWVRRTTGGGAILHGEDLTYALALPPAMARQMAPAEWHQRIHQVMLSEVRKAKLEAWLQDGPRKQPNELDYLCFGVPQPDDIVAPGGKVVGSAQRLRHGALLQHGSIYGPARAVLQERLPGALVAVFGWETESTSWTPADWEAIRILATEKFASPAWNERR
jgi:lipoate-protein ligase A